MNRSAVVKLMLSIFSYYIFLENFVNTQLRTDYHQTDYDVKLERCELTRYNGSIYRSPSVAFVPFNRTFRVFNGSTYFLKDLTSNVKLSVQFYKFMSNEYRFFPITVNVNACYELHRDVLKSKTMLKEYSNIGECPWKKGFKYISNGKIRISDLPPYIPRGSYRVQIIFHHNADFMFEMNGYATISDKPQKWERRN